MKNKYGEWTEALQGLVKQRSISIIITQNKSWEWELELGFEENIKDVF